MICQNCLKSLTSRLQPNDLIILDYLNENEAFSPQFSLSKKKRIMKDLNMSIHIASTSLLRLEVLGLVDMPKGTQDYKYFITRDGMRTLELY